MTKQSSTDNDDIVERLKNWNHSIPKTVSEAIDEIERLRADITVKARLLTAQSNKIRQSAKHIRSALETLSDPTLEKTNG